MVTVAVLGTGIMGGPMARHVVAAGMDVRVWNRTRSKAQALAEHGAVVADSPGEAVAEADVVVTMLADGPVVDEVVREAWDQLADGAVWIQSSTVGVAWSERLREAAEQRGLRYVDAPVLGTRQPAEAGTLTVLASGDRALEDVVRPVFEAVGARTLWLGEGAEASAMKLVANNWVVGLLGVLGESVGLARGLGLRPEQFLEIIAGGPLDAGYAQLKGKAMIAGEFPPAFPLRLALKDARLVAEAGDGAGLELPVVRGVAALFERAAAAGHGDEDMAAIVEGVLQDA